MFERETVESYRVMCVRHAASLNDLAYSLYIQACEAWKLGIERYYGPLERERWPAGPLPPLFWRVGSNDVNPVMIELSDDRAEVYILEPDFGGQPLPAGVADLGPKMPGYTDRFHRGPKDTMSVGSIITTAEGYRVKLVAQTGPFGNWMWYQVVAG
jgi:hypothetical protein